VADGLAGGWAPPVVPVLPEGWQAEEILSRGLVAAFRGGGTNMGTGIAAAVALPPRPAVTVVLTGGYTPWPAEAPRGTRVVVGLLGAEAPDAPGWARAVRVEV